MIMNREFYDYPILFAGKQGFLLWFRTIDSNQDMDEVTVDDDNRIPLFANLDSLKNYAEKRGLCPLQLNQSGQVDLDYLERWLSSRRTLFNCSEVLNCWNLFGDVSHSIGGDFDRPRERTQKIYRKILWGNNLPAVTPPHVHYQPHWSPLELALIRLTLKRGLEMFRSAAYFHDI